MEPKKGTRMGVIYMSAAEHTFKDDLQLRGLGPTLEASLEAAGLLGTQVEFKVNRPQQVQTSLYQDLTRRLTRLSQLSQLTNDNLLNRLESTRVGLHYRWGVRSSTSARS